jgi:murein DD-endopeptidase MepM/ murein hydrolase activator NlpD
MLPTGTPIYAIRGGRVVTVQYWPYNWWDHGCGQNPAGCQTCGIGVTIEDDEGTRWAYCHGNAAHVAAGTTIAAGTQILTSPGNTGRSSGPHLHLQIRTADGLSPLPAGAAPLAPGRECGWLHPTPARDAPSIVRAGEWNGAIRTRWVNRTERSRHKFRGL